MSHYCVDLQTVVAKLNLLRKSDDLVVLELNDALPTKSFDANSAVCKQHCEKFAQIFKGLAEQRLRLIDDCIASNEQRIAAGVEHSSIVAMRAANRQLRGERDVEEIITSRSETAVKDRCSKIVA